MAEEQKEVIDFDDEEVKAVSNSGMEELDVDDLKSQWIPHPKVGEEIEFEIAKIFKDKNIKAKTKEGKPFSSALSGVDFKYTIETKDGKKYSPASWEVWGKVKALILEHGKLIKVKVKHIRDGMKEKDGEPNYEVTLIQ